jgi:hypothetical protein
VVSTTHKNTLSRALFFAPFLVKLVSGWLIIGICLTIGIRASLQPLGAVMAGDKSRSVTLVSSWPPCQRRLPQRRASDGVQLIVERVVEKVASASLANYSILTKSNYNQWSLLMKIKMEVRGLWVAVDPDSVEFQVDRMALDAICSVVSSEMITTLTMSDSTQEAWESIMVMCIDDDRIRKASTQKLRHEYEVPKFHDKEGVEDFTM